MQDISKSILARAFIFGIPIGTEKQITWSTFEDFPSNFDRITELKNFNSIFKCASVITVSTGVIQLIPPVLSSETLLHILLSSEYSGFRPSTTAVVTISAPVSVSTGPKFRRYSAQLSRKIVKKVFIVISNVFPTFLTYR